MSMNVRPYHSTRQAMDNLAYEAYAAGLARGRALGAREDELMLFLAESVRDAFECDCEFEGDTCPCEGDGNDDEGCWRCQANAAIEARRAGRGA
jgi:hypothetical protein